MPENEYPLVGRDPSYEGPPIMSDTLSDFLHVLAWGEIASFIVLALVITRVVDVLPECIHGKFIDLSLAWIFFVYPAIIFLLHF